VFIHVFTLYLFEKYQHVITAIITLCNYTVDPKPTHTTTPVPNLTRITPQ